MNQRGSTTPVVITAVVAILLLSGVAYWRYNTKPKTSSSPQPAQSTQTTTKLLSTATLTSPMAKYTVKYQENWAQDIKTDSKNDVEYVTLSSPTMIIQMTSYGPKSSSSTKPTDGKCAPTDCTTTVASKSITINGIGKATLDQVKFKLRDGEANALVVRLPDGTYYIKSPKANGVTTTFRAESSRDDTEEQMMEKTEEFPKNHDYAQAEQILSSISY